MGIDCEKIYMLFLSASNLSADQKQKKKKMLLLKSWQLSLSIWAMDGRVRLLDKMAVKTPSYDGQAQELGTGLYIQKLSPSLS